MISRRKISLAGGASLMAVHRLGRGQAGAPMRRVGWLGSTSMAAGGYIIDGFKQGMRNLGWIEGRNVEYRFVFTGGDLSRFDVLAAELIAQKFELMMVSSVQAAIAVQRATKTIPIVVAVNGWNLVELGLVSSLAKPGGNVTGLASQGEEAFLKLIELLHEIAPRARRFAFVLGSAGAAASPNWPKVQNACAALGLDALHVNAAAFVQASAATIDEIVRQRADAVIVVVSPAIFLHRARLNELLQATRLPVAYTSRENVLAGGLLSYATDLVASARYAAKFADKILKGAKPADLPVEQPTKFDLVVNKKTAKALGITIPYSVMLRATEVIE